jgi:hypothetical protein
MKTKYVVLLGFAAVLAVVLAVPILKSKLDEYRVELPDVSRPGHVVTLDQNWTDEQREQFHFTAQGTRHSQPEEREEPRRPADWLCC